MPRTTFMDLPLEVLHDILEATLIKVSLKHALRIRQVNRLFSQGIMRAISPNTVTFSYERYLEILQDGSIPESIFLRVLSTRLVTTYTHNKGRNDEVPLETIDLLMSEFTGQSENDRLQYIFASCVTEENYEPENPDRWAHPFDRHSQTDFSDKEKRAKPLSDALAIASYLGKLPMVEHFLCKGADPHGETNGGRYKPALIQAAKRGHRDVVQVLLSHGADLNTGELTRHDRYTNGALNQASRNGHLNVVEFLLNRPSMLLGSDPKHKSSKPVLESAMISAAEGGHQDIVMCLMQRHEWGSHDPCKDKDLLYAILLAGVRGSRETIVRWMLDFGVDVNHVLPKSCQHNKNVDNISILQIAALRGRPRIVRLLLENGVRRRVPALAYAARNGHIEVAHLLLDTPGDDLDVKYMIQGRGYFTSKMAGDKPPIYEAAIRDHMPMVRLLLERGKDIMGDWTSEALKIATTQNNKDIAELLASAASSGDASETAVLNDTPADP